MVSRLISQFYLTRRGIFSLALLPAFLCGTLPHTACICADGHREEHCRALSRHTSAPTSAGKLRCNCCKPRDEAPDCCQTEKQDSQRQAGLTASGNCCHPIIETPAPLASSTK